MMSSKMQELLAPLDKKAAEVQAARERLAEKNKIAAREMILAIQLSLSRYPIRER